MKNGLIIVAMLLSVNSLWSMQSLGITYKLPQLCFTLGKHRNIQAYSALNGMEFYEKPEQFAGKDILAILNLPAEKRNEILQAFDKASKKNDEQVVQVEYTITTEEGKEEAYKANITPLEGLSSFFVQVLNK